MWDEFLDQMGSHEEVLEMLVVVAIVGRSWGIGILQVEGVPAHEHTWAGSHPQLVCLKHSPSWLGGSKDGKRDFVWLVLDLLEFFHEHFFQHAALCFTRVYCYVDCGFVVRLFLADKNLRFCLSGLELIVNGYVTRMADEHVFHETWPVWQPLIIHPKLFLVIRVNSCHLDFVRRIFGTCISFARVVLTRVFKPHVVWVAFTTCFLKPFLKGKVLRSSERGVNSILTTILRFWPTSWRDRIFCLVASDSARRKDHFQKKFVLNGPSLQIL